MSICLQGVACSKSDVCKRVSALYMSIQIASHICENITIFLGTCIRVRLGILLQKSINKLSLKIFYTKNEKCKTPKVL